MKTLQQLKNMLPLLFCMVVCLCSGQAFEKWTKGPKYLTFVTLKKSEIKEIITANKHRERETKIMLDGDSMLIHVIEPVLVAWDEKGDEIDTMNVIDHTLFFDSSSVCVRDVKKYLVSKDPDYEALFATRSLRWKWKKTSTPDLYVTVYKFHLSMKMQKSTRRPPLTLIYTLHPAWTKEEYSRYFSE